MEGEAIARGRAAAGLWINWACSFHEAEVIVLRKVQVHDALREQVEHRCQDSHGVSITINFEGSGGCRGWLTFCPIYKKATDL